MLKPNCTKQIVLNGGLNAPEGWDKKFGSRWLQVVNFTRLARAARSSAEARLSVNNGTYVNRHEVNYISYKSWRTTCIPIITSGSQRYCATCSRMGHGAVCLSVCLSVCLPVCVSVCLPRTYIHIRRYIYLYLCNLSVYTYLSSLSLSLPLSLSLYVDMSVYVCMYRMYTVSTQGRPGGLGGTSLVLISSLPQLESLVARTGKTL